MSQVAESLKEAGEVLPRPPEHSEVKVSENFMPPSPAATDTTLDLHDRTLHSVLDSQLEALALGQASLSTLESENGGPGLVTFVEDLPMFKRKGPNSLLGTGSSIASASDHEVSSSDFESDSGIENSHAEIPSPEILGVGSVKERKKDMEPYLSVLPHDDLAVTAAAAAAGGSEDNQSDEGVKSCDLRIDSYIQCLDEKVLHAMDLSLIRESWQCSILNQPPLPSHKPHSNYL